MGRIKGQASYASNFEVIKQAPLDSRMVVDSFADLIKPETWQDKDGNVWLYDGMPVIALDGGGIKPVKPRIYILKDKDKYTEASSWTESGQDVPAELTAHLTDKNNPHKVTAEQVGLGNVTNEAQIPLSQKGKASGVASLDSNGKVPASQLPSYVDDILEVKFVSEDMNVISDSPSDTLLVVSGENTGYYVREGSAWKKQEDLSAGKIYLVTQKNTVGGTVYNVNTSWRWSGTRLVQVGNPLVIGEVEGTAFDGSRGKSLEEWRNKQQSITGNNITNEQLLDNLAYVAFYMAYNDVTEFCRISQSSDRVSIAVPIVDMTKRQTKNLSRDLPAASTSAAGVMSSSDKQALEDLKGITVELVVAEI